MLDLELLLSLKSQSAFSILLYVELHIRPLPSLAFFNTSWKHKTPCGGNIRTKRFNDNKIMTNVFVGGKTSAGVVIVILSRTKTKIQIG